MHSESGSIDVEGGKVWYEIAGSGGATPLLLLHGGPGATSYYFEPLRRLGDERPIVFYDQLGCGRSDRPDDKSLWTVERSLRELQQVRDEADKLGISPAALAIRFCASNPNVSCVIPGVRTAEQATENARCWEALPQEVMARLRGV